MPGQAGFARPGECDRETIELINCVVQGKGKRVFVMTCHYPAREKGGGMVRGWEERVIEHMSQHKTLDWPSAKRSAGGPVL